MNTAAAIMGLATIALAASAVAAACEVDRKSIALPSDKAALVTPKKGEQVLIELNPVSATEATYRWRHLGSEKGGAKSGGGRVFEDYDHVRLPNGDTLVKRKNEERDLHIIAGQTTLQWSAKDKTSGWLYYCPATETVQLVDLTQYQRRP